MVHYHAYHLQKLVYGPYVVHNPNHHTTRKTLQGITMMVRSQIRRSSEPQACQAIAPDEGYDHQDNGITKPGKDSIKNDSTGGFIKQSLCSSHNDAVVMIKPI